MQSKKALHETVCQGQTIILRLSFHVLEIPQDNRLRPPPIRHRRNPPPPRRPPPRAAALPFPSAATHHSPATATSSPNEPHFIHVDNHLDHRLYRPPSAAASSAATSGGVGVGLLGPFHAVFVEGGGGGVGSDDRDGVGGGGYDEGWSREGGAVVGG